MKRIKKSISELWDNFKWLNIHAIGKLKGEKWQGERSLRNNAPHFSNLIKNVNSKIQEIQQTKLQAHET